MLEVRSIRLERANRMVLRDVSLTLAPGETLAVVGPNGAGKTTLLRCLAGILTPVSGEVLLDSKPVAGRTRREVARMVAYAPQDSEVRFGFTVFESVLMGRHPWRARFGSPPGEDEAAARKAMEALDVAHLSERPVTELSGGEKKRVALARTLAQGGRFYLLDEPVSGLDIRHALMAMRVFAGQAGQGAGVAVVLHDLNLAAMFCGKMLLLDAGRVAAYGATPGVLTEANIWSVFGVRARIEGAHVRFLEE